MVRRLLPILLLLLAAALMERATVSAQTQLNRAAVVARFADGQNLVKCVTFPEASITGEELLRRTGWSIVIDAETDKGSAICKVNDVGCGVDDCFCRCRGGAQCEYWSYWHRVNNEWEYSDSGASSYSVSDGALEGWSWGPGNWVTGTEPPDFTFQQICNANTNPIVRGNTPEPETDQPPDGDFDADEILIDPGACTILTWVIFDATSVTLDGVQVTAQDRVEVCPAATQRYVLIATNGVGQLTREVTIEVLDGGPEFPTPGAPPTVASQPQVPVTQQPSPDIRFAPVTAQVAGPLSTVPPPEQTTPAEMSFVSEATPAPFEVTATPEIRPIYTVTPDALALALTALPTPVVVAQAPLDARGGDRPTPTPILLALAGDAAGVETASQAQPAQTVLDPTALPGYAAFLLMAAGLLGAAAWVWQRSRVH